MNGYLACVDCDVQVIDQGESSLVKFSKMLDRGDMKKAVEEIFGSRVRRMNLSPNGARVWTDSQTTLEVMNESIGDSWGSLPVREGSQYLGPHEGVDR